MSAAGGEGEGRGQQPRLGVFGGIGKGARAGRGAGKKLLAKGGGV